MKKISISYCGGCNAGYDRVEFVKVLLERLKNENIAFEIVDNDEESDISIILAGCQALCVADRDDLGHMAKQRFVVGADSLNAIKMTHEESQQKLIDVINS